MIAIPKLVFDSLADLMNHNLNLGRHARRVSRTKIKIQKTHRLEYAAEQMNNVGYNI